MLVGVVLFRYCCKSNLASWVVQLHRWKSPHRVQACDLFDPVWICMCLVRMPFRANTRGHIEQANGRSPVCVRMWSLRVPFWENALEQIEQTNGRSPVCVCIWSVSFDFWLNARSQTLHWCSFSQIWQRRAYLSQYGMGSQPDNWLSRLAWWSPLMWLINSSIVVNWIKSYCFPWWPNLHSNFGVDGEVSSSMPW